MKRIAMTATLMTAVLAGGCASTGNYQPGYSHNRQHDRVYEQRNDRGYSYDDRYERPRHVNAPVYNQVPPPAQSTSGNWLPQAAGAAAGGLLGAQVGRGSGRVAGAAVGAAAGSTIGGNMNGGSSTSANCR